MTIILCPDCEADLSLGRPSFARWVGPDGGNYCSLHFINRFGHAERLVPLEDYEPPTTRKPPAPKKPAAKAKKDTEVEA